MLVNHQALNNHGHAVRINNATEVNIVNPTYAGNSQERTGSYAAVMIDGPSSENISLLSGRIGSPVQGYGATQSFAVQSSDHVKGVITIDATNMRGNSLGAAMMSSNLAPGSHIQNSPGYNPKGVAPLTPSASPWVYRAGLTMELVNFYGGIISSIAKDSVVLCSATPCAIMLAPLETIVVTYANAPNVVSSRN